MLADDEPVIESLNLDKTWAIKIRVFICWVFYFFISNRLFVAALKIPERNLGSDK